ncbi:hypothetical protein LPY66_00405 [Dehalobacter sp. DCM]|uniref:hypothetical protein n=1 Tax=Dehalobacter sp. DCM TaxID=2907827 RepID=UPI0030817F73|nr:hypothetical protein LPY66_00405 [Dehalobacter sp. DCM]
MREQEFENYLLLDDNIVSKVKAVRSRVNKARMIERHFDTSLDYIVSDNKRMYESLLKIKAEMNDINGNISNALRKYYHFANGVLFPTLSSYEK